MMRKLVFLIVFVALTALVGGLAWFQFKVKPQMIHGFIAAMPKPVSGVAAEAARPETWTPRIAVIGTFKAVPGIDLAGEVAGIVSDIKFTNGQDVQKGQLLVQIDDSTEQADLKSAAALLKNAELAFDRQKSLTASGVAAKSNFDSAQAARDQGEAAIERIRALIAEKAVVAPFAGRVGIRKVDVGQYVAAGAPLVTLQQLDPIYLDFQTPEQNYAVLAVGQTVEARVDALDGKVFTGKIRTIDARINQDTRNILVRAEIDNPDKRVLPGMFANITILAGAPQQVLTLPRTSIAYSLYGDSVYVVMPDEAKDGKTPGQHVERRFVRTGESREDRVAILEGVAAGEQIVTQGQVKLQPNAAVHIEPDSEMKPAAVRPRE